MEILLGLLLFPLIWPFIAKQIWKKEFSYFEMGWQIGIMFIAVTLCWFLSKAGKTADVEIWNGSVISKHRDHGSYNESYDCNCHRVCSGSGDHKTCRTKCSTCYRKHYTVKWTAKTTVGNIRFDYLDRTSRSVYNTPDPIAYKNCKSGEPASIEHTYTNYVKAVPDSLFNHDMDLSQFDDKIPSYPRVHSFYRYNRVINVDSKVAPLDIDLLNNNLNQDLRELGAKKKVNVIVILTEIDDPTYKYAVEYNWLGGKKNDVVVLMGLDDTTVTWTDVFTWAGNSGNELFQVTLRDRLQANKTFDTNLVYKNITETVNQYYDKPSMKDFEYLADEIIPSDNAILGIVFLVIFGSIGLTIVFNRTDL